VISVQNGEKYMSSVTINITDENRDAIEALSQRTGRTRDEIVNRAVEHLLSEQPDFPSVDWKSGWRRAAGIWQDRLDLDDFVRELRRESSRVDAFGGIE
jgi:predicted transcriptional regulator